jgi:hypothetical protein
MHVQRAFGDLTAIDSLFALQWHQDGLTPYITFQGKRDHGDAEIEAATVWLSKHISVASPDEDMIRRSAARFAMVERPSACCRAIDEEGAAVICPPTLPATSLLQPFTAPLQPCAEHPALGAFRPSDGAANLKKLVALGRLGSHAPSRHDRPSRL